MGTSMAQGFNSSKMEIATKELTRTESLKEKALMPGTTAPSIKDSSKMDFALDKECGNTEQNSTKEPTSMISEVGKASTLGQEAASIKEISLKILDTVTEKCTGTTSPFIKASGAKELKTEKVKSGKKESSSKKDTSSLVNSNLSFLLKKMKEDLLPCPLMVRS